MSRYKVYSKNGNTERCVLNKIEYNGSFMDERSVSASVESPTPINFEIYDYITYRGEKFELDYKPTSVKVSSKNSSGDAYRYELLFVSLKYELERCEMRDLVPYDNGIVYPTPLTIEFTGTAQKLAERVQACLDVMYSGSQKWTITVLPGASDEEKNISISQANCWSAVSLFNTEYGLNFYISGRTVTVGDVGTAIGFTFQYGKGKGLYKIERVSDTDQGIVTRLRAYGGTNNIGDNYLRDKTEWPDSVLPASMYLPNLMLPGFETTKVDYIESDTVSEYGIREGSVVYEDIYPSIVGMTNSKGDRIDKIKGAESITDDTASEFWITTYDLEFEKPLSDYIVTGGVPTIYIKSGQLQGYSFEINPDKIEEQSDGGYRIYLSRNTDNGYTVPNADVNLTAGTEFVFLGITMPKAYIESAENRLLARAQEYLGKYGKTNYGYEIGLDEIFAARDESIYNSLYEGKRLKVVDTDLRIDEEITIQSLTITEEDGGLPTYKITLNNEVSASTLNRIQGQVSQLESTVTNGFTLLKWQTEQYLRRFGRPYALWTRDGTSMWLSIDEDGSVATLVGSLYATKDIVAYSKDEEIEDAELPIAGYGTAHFGLTAIKQGGGLMIDSNNLVYIDPAYAGGGGIDTGELEQYLTSHFYMKKNDPASYLLMTGYAMPEIYAPVTSTDTVLTAIGKLERNFGNYVTIATQQTVTGKKTFTQDIIGEADIIAKSASAAIADAELPIASSTQLGLIKVGTGFEITADGVLNNTGTGGLTEVYWSDVMNKPTTLAGYGITASDVLTTLKTVDGSGSGLDADTLDGIQKTALLTSVTSTSGNNLSVIVGGTTKSVAHLFATNFTPTSIPENANLNSYNIPGMYYCPMNATVATLDNSPTNNAFSLLVERHAGYKQTLSEYYTSTSAKTWTRNYYKGTWGPWRQLAYTTDNVASASKLSPGCYLWGNKFTGENDVTGSMTVSNSFQMKRTDNNYFISSSGNGETIINALGNKLTLGYIGTSAIAFWAGTGEIGVAGSKVGEWTTEGLCIGGSSHNAKLHVVGDGLFTGDVIARSTSSAITDTELPIASATQLGLVKIGTGFTITADGVLNNTGGGLSEVYWDQIKETPTTLSGYGITASDVLTKLKTVDGSGSGLDADLLDGLHSSSFQRAVGDHYELELSGSSRGRTVILLHPDTLSGTENNLPGGYSVQGIFYLYRGSGNCTSSIIITSGAGYSSTWSNGSMIFLKGGGNYNDAKFVTCTYGGKLYRAIYIDNGQDIQQLDFRGIIHNRDANFGKAIQYYSYASSSVTNSEINDSIKDFDKHSEVVFPTDIHGNISGNSSTATKLQTARTINGTSFDGTASITTAKWGTARNIYIRDASQAHTGAAVSVDGSANEYLLLPSTITASLSGNASTATKLQTARTIWGNSFNGSANIGGTLTPLADNTYDLGTTSRRWRYLFFYGYNGSWIAGKTRAVINIESQNSSTSTYFPYLRIESKYGDVFNIGMLQSTSESNNQFGIFRFASDRTANGTDSSFYMRGDGNMFGSGTLTMSGDVIAKSASSSISDSELPIASSGQLGLIRIGSGLTINSSGVVSVTGGGTGGSDVYWGAANTNMVPLYVDGSYYELARNNHSHDVATSGSGNAVTGISFSGRKMTLAKGSTFSLSGHTHSQYLTSHQRIYTLTIQKNGSTIGSYTPNQANKTINITVEDATADPFNGGTITNALYINIPSGGSTKPFKVRYGSGNYFFLNHGGTPALMANNADSYNRNANITFNNSSVAATGFTYTGTSDMRLKDRIGDITGVLDKLNGIEAFFFRYKAEPTDIHIGVSAQEVIKVFPEVVPLIGDYYQLRYTDFLTAVSVNGIKELYALQKQTTNEIDALKRRVALLEAENQHLWNLINEKEAA